MEARHGPAEARVARELIDWARVQLPRFTWGTGTVDVSFIPVLDYRDQNCFPLALVVSPNYGAAEIQFQHLARRPPFDDVGLRREFLSRLNGIPGVSIPEDAVARRPKSR